MPTILLADLVDVLIEEVSQKHNLTDEIVRKEIGLRPGEKRYEELMTEEEKLHAWETSDMFIVPSPFKEQSSSTRYPDACLMQSSEISSHRELPIDRDTLRKWITEERLV